mmetsp:Transcript_28218/g.70943  ORF Transcript_28218/g.70943 Transcript_28218/m.70943 type:complete len:278 (+) Transcript_28218:137-970(+)
MLLVRGTLPASPRSVAGWACPQAGKRGSIQLATARHSSSTCGDAAPVAVPLSSRHGELAEQVATWLSDTYDAINYGEVFEKVEEAQLLSAVDDDTDEVIYGEFSLPLLCALLESANLPEGAVFVDIGSGRGQLCLTAAAVRGWKACIGVELLPELHFMAEAAYAQAGASGGFNGRTLSPCTFLLGDMYQALGQVRSQLQDASTFVVFLYATKFQTRAEPEEDILLLSSTLRAALPACGTVITINNRLDERDGFQLESHQTGPNPEGGELQVYTYTSV